MSPSIMLPPQNSHIIVLFDAYNNWNNDDGCMTHLTDLDMSAFKHIVDNCIRGCQ